MKAADNQRTTAQSKRRVSRRHSGAMAHPQGRSGEPGPPPETAPDADSRARIIQTASEHFFAHGCSTTMDDLARELGMSKKTLYQHFPAKEQLLSAVIQAKARDIRQTLEPITEDPHLSYPEKLRRVVTGLAAKLAPIQPVFVYSLKRYAPAQYREVEEIRRQNFSAVFKRLLEQGCKAGEIRPDLDIPFTVELILGAFRSMIESEALNRLQLTPAAAMQKTLDLIFEGLLVRKKTSL